MKRWIFVPPAWKSSAASPPSAVPGLGFDRRLRGGARGRPALDANPAEVDRILVVPLAELVAPGRYWQERWDETDEGGRTMHFFDLGEDVIWGATAQLLHSFLVHVLRRAEAPGPGDPDGAH